MIARACRIYDKNSNRMLYPKDLSKMGVFLTAAGDPVQIKKGTTKIVLLHDVVVMRETGLNTDDGTKIWEDDIIEAGVMTGFGSMIKTKGCMKWNRFEGKWYVYIPKPPIETQNNQSVDFSISAFEVVGNIHENAGMLKQVLRETE